MEILKKHIVGNYIYNQSGNMCDIIINNKTSITTNGEVTEIRNGNIISQYSLTSSKSVNGSTIISDSFKIKNTSNENTVSVSAGDIIMHKTVKVQPAATGIISLGNIANVADGIVIGIA